MATTLQLKEIIASLLGRTTVDALNPVNMTPPGIDIDLGLVALNNARRTAERAHDFKYAETNVNLNIGASGSIITGATGLGNLTVSGTLNPNAAGDYSPDGTRGGLPSYAYNQGAHFYYLSYLGAASGWIITQDGFNSTTLSWTQNVSSLSPNGAYTHQGTATGNATVSAGTAIPIGIKRIKTVLIPVGNSDYEPIEFLTNDQFLSRVRMQVGRQHFDPNKSLSNLGSTLLGNPLCYQNGQTLYLAPANLPFPVMAQLNVVQWMPDYAADGDTDFFTIYAPEYLQWQGTLELNKLLRRFAPKQEGNIDETSIQQEAEGALQTLIDWDISTVRGTSTPNGAKNNQPPTPAPPANG